MVRFFPGSKTPTVVQNWAYNPSFDLNTGGYQIIGGPATLARADGCARATWTADSPGPRAGIELSSGFRVTAAPGTSWRVLANVGFAGTLTTAARVHLYVQWYSGSTLLSESKTGALPVALTGRPSTQLIVTATAPTSTTALGLTVALDTGWAPVPAGTIMYLDNILIATGYSGEYFDGNTTDDAATYAWLGTPGYSYSTRTAYTLATSEISTPLITYERTVTDDSRGIELQPVGSPYPTVVYPYQVAAAQTGHLTCLYDDETQVERLRALAAAGPVRYQGPSGTTLMHIRRIEAADIYGLTRDKIAIGVDYVRMGA